jgi:hypothetical protein
MALAGSAMGTIAQQFVDAFNRRDANDLVALVDPGFEWRPSVLVGGRRTYHGHQGLRQWLADLARLPVEHHARIHDVEVIDDQCFLVHSEVLIDDEPVTPSSMVARLGEDGKLVEARAYLSDEPLLRGRWMGGSENGDANRREQFRGRAAGPPVVKQS